MYFLVFAFNASRITPKLKKKCGNLRYNKISLIVSNKKFHLDKFPQRSLRLQSPCTLQHYIAILTEFVVLKEYQALLFSLGYVFINHCSDTK